MHQQIFYNHGLEPVTYESLVQDLHHPVVYLSPITSRYQIARQHRNSTWTGKICG